jgi:hypothetical protein
MKFSEKEWFGIAETVGKAFGLSKERMEHLKGKKTAKLIAGIPFLAGCRNPDRIAASHLAIYLLGIAAPEISDHRKTDDDTLDARLERISWFDGGDEAVISRGMDLLTLQMLAGYNTDREKDKAKNKYNPLNAGLWDFERDKRELINSIESVKDAEMDQIMTAGDALNEWWQ